MASFLDPLLRSGESSLALTNTRHNRVVARTLLTAFDSKSRRQGLLHHASLPDDSALIIAPSSAIHTFPCAFVIDVVHRRDVRVLKLRRDMPPRVAVASLACVCRPRARRWRSRANGYPASDTLPDRRGLRLIEKLPGARRTAGQIDESSAPLQRGCEDKHSGIVARRDVALRHRHCSTEGMPDRRRDKRFRLMNGRSHCEMFSRCHRAAAWLKTSGSP